MRFVLFSCLLYLSIIQTIAQGLQVGAAKAIITPHPLLPVSGGIGTPTPASIAQGDLYVRVMVIEQHGTKVAFVGIDNLGWPAVLGDRSRALVKHVPAANILIGATHTHSAPDAYGFADQSGRSYADTAYLRRCILTMAKTIDQAATSLKPARLRIATGEAEGKIAYNYYAEQLYDPRCGVIQAVSIDDKGREHTIGTLINYAIHPEVIGSDQGILSPDLCGPLYDRLEDQLGGVAIFINGAQGGMITADNRREDSKEDRTWQECLRIGKSLADEAIRIVKSQPFEEDPQLHIESSTLTFPITSPLIKLVLSTSPLLNESITLDSISTMVNLVNLGAAQMLTIPGEALPNIGYYLKRKMKGKDNFLLGLTNDAFGYILTEVDFDSFKRYEYISTTSLGEMTGEIFIDHALQLIENAPDPNQR